MLFKGPVRNGFYPFTASSSTTGNHLFFAATIKASSEVWHQRLGHPSFKVLNKIVSTSSLPVSISMTQSFCSNCAMGKSTKLQFVSVSNITTRPLQLLHTDVWGPSFVMSISSYRYYLIVVDDYIKYCWFFPLKCKSKVFQTFLEFKALVENMLHTSIVVLRSDSGAEFLSSVSTQFLKTNGIHHQLSFCHTPEQNGCAECKHIIYMIIVANFVTSPPGPPPHPGLDSAVARYCPLWAPTTPSRFCFWELTRAELPRGSPILGMLWPILA